MPQGNPLCNRPERGIGPSPAGRILVAAGCAAKKYPDGSSGKMMRDRDRRMRLLKTMVLSATVDTMSNTPTPKLRVFAFKDVVRFARKFHISDEGVWNVVRAQPDADLGGGLYKYRIARPGEGSRGGGRVLIALKIGSRAILMFAWEKKDMETGSG